MNHKSKIPKIPKIPAEKMAELVRACELAFSGHPMDAFMDKVFEETKRPKRPQDTRGEQSRCE